MKKNFNFTPPWRGKQKNKGYTLIETLIAVALFIVVVTIGMGALLNANALYNKSKDMRSIMDNLSFTIEDMSRNLRTGYNYQCFDSSHPTVSLSTTSAGYPRSCPSGWALAFEPANGNPNSYGCSASNFALGLCPAIADQWAYLIHNGMISKSTDGGQTFVQLTPAEVTIDTSASSFSVLGAESPSSGDYQQPFVIIHLVGTITYAPNKNNPIVTPFSLQTSVSQRATDI
ncbi:MAG: prepilin-type N-terminal cleavage/methylation domain-containing protein [Candidatus Pacebacteria bacterium]|nr:prepilin-type N-terminal cleavage/methylation domain-containing protein [Candidatus Paceibacterota bacterium]